MESWYLLTGVVLWEHSKALLVLFSPGVAGALTVVFTSVAMVLDILLSAI